MPIKGFDTVEALGEHFAGEVYRGVGDETLFVFDSVANCWHRYRWTRGKREIRYLGPLATDLPLVVQIYPIR